MMIDVPHVQPPGTSTLALQAHISLESRSCLQAHTSLVRLPIDATISIMLTFARDDMKEASAQQRRFEPTQISCTGF